VAWTGGIGLEKSLGYVAVPEMVAAAVGIGIVEDK